LCDLSFWLKLNLKTHIKNCTGSRNISSGEFEVINALKDLGFKEDEDYLYDVSFYPLTDFCGRRLRFDFLFHKQKKVIEFDGLQHLKPVKWGSSMTQEDAEEKFKYIQVKDKMKDDFCAKFGYQMIRIPYKKKNQILSILSEELIDIVDW